MRILVVEDEQDLNRIIAESLEDEGYSVDRCFEGQTALDFLTCAEYDTAIVDILMPRMDGLELVRQLRAQGNLTPILFLTARDGIEDRVAGLDAGGDYYLVKPFSFDELKAVVRMMARRPNGSTSSVYSIDGLVIDTAAHTVSRDDVPIVLSAKEYALLEFLARNEGRILSRDMIRDNLWNFDFEGTSNVVDVYISYLRKKIDRGFEKPLIHTVWGVGWKLSERP